MKVVIVDDDIHMAEMIKEILVSTANKKNIPLKAEIIQSVEWLLADLREGHGYQVYFIDVEMPKMTGLELVAEIRKIDSGAVVVFVSAHEKYAIDGYEVSAYRYILKSMLLERAPKLLEELQQKFHEFREDYYMIETQFRRERFLYSEIYEVHKQEKMAVFLTKRGEFRQRCSLQKVWEKLKNKDFLWIERGSIVNMRYITRIQKNEIFLENGNSFMVSRAKYLTVRETIGKYWMAGK